MESTILRINNMKKYFPVRAGVFKRTVDYVKAVDGISFELKKGETLGIVGESGCGKSTTARVILGLLPITSGEIIYKDKHITTLKGKNLQGIKKNIQIVFQDPYGSLNPRITVGEIIGEVLDVHKLASGLQREKRIEELLDLVGLRPEYKHRYPHEFSGGQRQRIGIARALAVQPEIIICDEPVSALDVSIQAQVINLIKELQCELNLSYVFISHDLSVVKHISDRVAVMYLGKIVEIGTKDRIFSTPKHPYTQALLSAIPVANPLKKKKHIILEGDVPSPVNPPSGCRFHTRCWKAQEKCVKCEPTMRVIGSKHEVSCHFV